MIPNLHLHSCYGSPLKAICKPDEWGKLFNGKTAALTDDGSLGGVVSFAKSMKGGKPIFGMEFHSHFIENKPDTSTVLLYAQNKKGWNNLVKANNAANMPENYFAKARLSMNKLCDFSTDTRCVTGHLNSEVPHKMFGENMWGALHANSYDECKGFVVGDWKENLFNYLNELKNVWQGNLYVGLQNSNTNLYLNDIVNKTLRWAAPRMGLKCIILPDSYYANKQDAADQRVLLAAKFECTLDKLHERIVNANAFDYFKFLCNNSFHANVDESYFTPEEIANTIEFAESFEKFSVLGKPTVPQYCTESLKYLEELCREKIIKGNHSLTYSDRLNHELSVVRQFPLLADYFLMVQDYTNWARSQGWLLSPGRGSAGGCLISYLLGITTLDPIKYGLIFERFYNAGRNTADHISLPDIDIDFPKEHKDKVVAYLKGKYGEDRVAQIATFTRIQGRGALKEVLRAHGSCDFETMNQITQYVPDEAKIADELQEMRDEDEEGEASIIEWALINNSDKLKQWVVRKPDGTLEGEFAQIFGQAMRLEGTVKSVSRHASGYVIAPYSLHQNIPMRYNEEEGNLYLALDMKCVEDMGLVKADLLGLNTLDKMMDAQHDINQTIGGN